MRRCVVVAALGATLALSLASPALAAVEGPCTGTATVTGSGAASVTVDANDPGPYEVPQSGTAEYQGQIANVPPGEQPFSGEVRLNLSPPLPDVVVADWSGTSDLTAKTGSYRYDLPSFVPRGVEVALTGTHTQGGVSCTATVRVKVAGSVANVYTVVSGAMALALGAGFVGLAVRPFLRVRATSG